MFYLMLFILLLFVKIELTWNWLKNDIFSTSTQILESEINYVSGHTI